MNDRTPLLVVTIVALGALAIFLNMDLLQPDFRYPDAVTQRLAWQGEPLQRSLRLREGLDLQGGLQVLLEADMRGANATDLALAANVIQNRVDALGVVEPLVQTQGSDKIVVELPGVTDPELAVRTVGETALLEFIYSGQEILQDDTEVLTSWTLERTLFDELPEEKQVPYEYTPESGADEEAAADEAAAIVSDADDEAAAEEAETTVGQAGEPAEAEPSLETTTELTTTSEADLTEGTDASPAITPTLAVTTTEGSETAGVEPSAPVTSTSDITATEGMTVTDEVSPTAEAEATEPVTPTEGAEGPLTVYPTVLTGDFLRRASLSLDQFSQISVAFELDSEGGRRMQSFSSSHVSIEGEKNEIMPITLDGRVVSSPRIEDSIGAQGQIRGNFSEQEAEVLVAQLRSGALPVPLEVVGQTRIGPTLGRQAVDAAIKGGVVGLLAVMVFMLIYYRLPGVLADIALVLYALLVLSLFRLFPVTLTLAGIAGFVLSLGMAVDANILIFERMKEELRSGRGIRAAMDTGFARAWPSIRDSNLSTLITCAILFWFGNQFGASIVKGFAVTLAIGVLTSLFTAITVTRTLLRLTSRVLFREDEDKAAEGERLHALFGV